MGPDEHERADDTRTVLIEAAYHTLCEHGYAEFSLRKVADEADMSRGLVHYHFESKIDLLVSLLEYLVGRFEARFEAPEADAALDRLDEILEWVAFGPSLFGRDGDDYFMAILELRAQAPYEDAIRTRLTRNFETVRDRIASVIQSGIENGQLVAADPEQTATFVLAAVDGARNADLTMATDGTVDVALTAIDRFVFDALHAT